MLSILRAALSWGSLGSSRTLATGAAILVAGAVPLVAFYDTFVITFSRIRAFIVGDSCTPTRGKPLRRCLKVAIIGGGIEASAVALWLRDAFGGDSDLDLALICDSSTGGRCKTVEYLNEHYEAGPSPAWGGGHYFRSLLGRLGLKLQPTRRTQQAYSIIDGSRLLFCTMGASVFRGSHIAASIVSQLQLTLRYGFCSLLKLRSLAYGEDGPNFRHLYKALQDGAHFAHPRELLAILGPACLRLSERSTEHWLVREQGLPRQLVSEVVEPILRATYGQGCADVHASAMLILLPMLRPWWGAYGNVFSVEGGMEQVPSKALEQAPVRLLRGSARLIRRKVGEGECDPNFEVAYVDASAVKSGTTPKGAEAGRASAKSSRRGGDAEGLLTELFHLVVIAHPLEDCSLDFEGCSAMAAVDVEATSSSSPTASTATTLQSSIVHLVHGRPNIRYIVGEGASAEDAADTSSNSRIQKYFMDHRGEGRAPVPNFLPTKVLTTADSSAPFYGIEHVVPVRPMTLAAAKAMIAHGESEHGEPQMYRVLAHKKLTSEELTAWFPDSKGAAAHMEEWRALPKYTAPQSYRPFVLDANGIFYVSAMEQVGSTLETSLISSRNVTNLIIDWVDQRRGQKRF
mmetsp:Transcript_48078/g.88590  ORF Transcript_48078/g.88590 Transcript_48078/m.88590 type:complete len:629 (-) Transcript_48078:131-2017(-)